MFAGKTEELLRRVRWAVIAGRRVQVFTHRLDLERYLRYYNTWVGVPLRMSGGGYSPRLWTATEALRRVFEGMQWRHGSLGRQPPCGFMPRARPVAGEGGDPACSP